MKTYEARWLLIDRYPDVVAIQSRASRLKFPERRKASNSTKSRQNETKLHSTH